MVNFSNILILPQLSITNQYDQSLWYWPHTPICCTIIVDSFSQEWRCILHLLLYVLPSVPHTGAYVSAQATLQEPAIRHQAFLSRLHATRKCLYWSLRGIPIWDSVWFKVQSLPCTLINSTVKYNFMICLNNICELTRKSYNKNMIKSYLSHKKKLEYHSKPIHLFCLNTSCHMYSACTLFIFIFFSVRELAVFYKSCNLIDSESGQYSPHPASSQVFRFFSQPFVRF